MASAFFKSAFNPLKNSTKAATKMQESATLNDGDPLSFAVVEDVVVDG